MNTERPAGDALSAPVVVAGSHVEPGRPADDFADEAEAGESAVRVSVTEVGDRIVVRAMAVIGRAAIRREQVPLKEIRRRLVRGVEDGLLGSLLRQVGGNKSRAARILQLDYKTVHSMAKNLRTAKEESP